MKQILTFIVMSFISISIIAQVTVNNNTMTVEQYIQTVLVGSGVTVTNIQFNGGSGNIVNEQVGSFNDVNSHTGLPDGLIMGSGDVAMAAQLNTGGGSNLGGPNVMGSDMDLASITPNQIFDECVIEFDFVPVGDTISFNYVFASEEYDEFVCGTVNDAFGFFLSGPNPAGGTYNAQNIALIPDPANPGMFTTTPVSINTVNLGVAGGGMSTAACTAIDPNFAAYNVFYTQNTTNTYEYDGRTVVLEARANVVCGATYHIKLAIGDGGDNVWDSGVFIEGGSFSSSQILVTIPPTPSGDSSVIEGCSDAVISFTRPETDTVLTITFGIDGNAINGTDYTFISNTITFPIGVDTVDLVITPIADGLVEGTDTIIISAFNITPCGDTIISSGTILIRDIPNMHLSSNNVNLVCPLDSVIVGVIPSGAVPPFSYVWTNSNGNVIGNNSDSIFVPGIQTDTFYVSVTDSCNLLTLMDTIIVTSNVPLLTLSAINDTTISCPGASVNIQAVANGGIPPIYDYSLNPGSINLSSQTFSTIVSPTSTTTYVVSVTDLCGTVSAHDTVTITVAPYTPPTVSLTDNITLPCPGQSVDITATISDGTAPYTYNWGSSSSSNSSMISISPNSSQTVSATITDACGNTANSSMNITVAPYTPMTVIGAQVDSICAGDIATLTAAVTDGTPPYLLSWSNGATGAFIDYTSSTIGVNTVSVTVTDQCGQQEFGSVDVDVIPCEVEIPTIFTPNGDGANDLLVFGSLSFFPDNKLTVFNRWGRKIYEKEGYQNDWNGEDYKEGTYFFVLELNGANDKVHKGSITLLK